MSSGLIAYAISGPTGVGKTEVALKLAHLINGELISIDSVQVFKHLRIGANKYECKPEEPCQHLIDQVLPSQDYNANTFFLSLKEKMIDVYSKKKVPILVGGTAFYYDWIFTGKPSVPEIPKSVREYVDTLLSEFSWDVNLDILSKIGFQKPSSINQNDNYRLKRCLEIFLFTGKTRDAFPRRKDVYLSTIEWIPVYLTSSRIAMYRGADKRCEKMILDGLIEETITLMRSGELVKHTSAGRAIGYAEAIEFIEELLKSSDLDYKIRAFLVFLDRFQSSTRDLIRKQESWFSNKLCNFVRIHRNFENTEDCRTIAENLANIMLLGKKLSDLFESTQSSSRLCNAKCLRNYRSINCYFKESSNVLTFIHIIEEFLRSN